MTTFILNMSETLIACFLIAAVGGTVTESSVSISPPSPTNRTTPPVNMTTSPVNMTTSIVNMTTSPVNMTTSPVNTTTNSPSPTPTTLARWQIHDKNGKLCMLMDFNGTLTFYKTSFVDVVVYIPQNNRIGKSNCNSKSANFVLEFIAAQGLWQLTLNFTNAGNSYELGGLSVSLYTTAGVLVSSGKTVATFFQLPVGDYYSCDEFNQQRVGMFGVNLTSPVFQPFVQQTSHGDLGNVSLCTPLTTPASNMTTHSSNMTTHSSNMTTHSGNMTTHSSNMTTKVTPKPIAKWQVPGKNGKICMLMDFTGILSYNTPKLHVSARIPDNSNISKSDCNSKGAKFFLEFEVGDIHWQLDLNFTNTGKLYELNFMSVGLNKTGDVHVQASGDLHKTLIKVPIGEYYHCDKFKQTIYDFTVDLIAPVFQPFVQQTSGGDLGEAFKCGSSLPSSGPNVGLIVGLTVGVITVIVALGVTFYYMRRRTADKRAYTSMN